jgi:hypothetical protein
MTESDERNRDSGRETPSPTPAPTEPGPFAENQLQVAFYIEEISLELRALARSARLESLAYFIDMAHVEAESTRRRCEAQMRKPARPLE